MAKGFWGFGKKKKIGRPSISSYTEAMELGSPIGKPSFSQSFSELEKKYPRAYPINQVLKKEKEKETAFQAKKSSQLQRFEMEQEQQKKGKSRLGGLLSGGGGGIPFGQKKCSYCGYPIPASAKVCMYCGREQPIQFLTKGITGAIVGLVFSVVLAAISGFIGLPLEQWMIILIGLGIFAVIFFKNSAIKALVALALVAVIGFSFMQTPFGQDLIDRVGLWDQVGQLNQHIQYVSCLLTNMLSVQNIMESGGLDAYCRKMVYETSITKEGCTNCLTMTATPKTQPGIPFVPELIDMTFTMSSDADHAARNLQIKSFRVGDKSLDKENITKCSENPCTLQPGESEDLSAVTALPCQKSVTYDIKSKYTYETTGKTWIKITSGKRIYEKRVITSSSGPLWIKIETDSSYYDKKVNNKMYLTITIENQGKGRVIIDKIVFRELPPDKNPKLFAGNTSSYKCDLFDIYKTNTSDGFVLNYSARLPNKGEFTFICKLENLKDIEFNITGPFLTYNFQVFVNYTYETTKTSGTIWIDTKNYPCVVGRIDKNGWRTHTENDCGGFPWSSNPLVNMQYSQSTPVSEKCANLKDFDSTPWYNYTYDDSEWTLVNLPNTGWGTSLAKSTTRFYRKMLFWDGANNVSFNVTAADGLECWVSSPKGDFIIFNHTTEYHLPGCRCGACKDASGNTVVYCNKSITMDIGCTQGTYVTGSKSDSNSELNRICSEWGVNTCKKCQPWDYAEDITSKLKVGENMVSCKVVDQTQVNIQVLIGQLWANYYVGGQSHFDIYVPPTTT